MRSSGGRREPADAQVGTLRSNGGLVMAVLPVARLEPKKTNGTVAIIALALSKGRAEAGPRYNRLIRGPK